MSVDETRRERELGMFFSVPIGESQLPRHLGGGSYTAPPPAESHAIVNAYTLAFFDRYLRGAVARDGWLAENHYGDAVVLEAKTG